jgi:hypothetical protein
MNNNAAPLLFNGEKAVAIASIFGWMNLFVQGLGSYYSGKSKVCMGMRGHLLWQSFVLFMEMLCNHLCRNANPIGKSIVMLVFFSIFVQAGEGTSFG